ncbi:regulatory protein RecX [Herbiconiux sp. UC225_62]|uniref:regulatory protein RecX n=1 Tax=Herbiconiux sp. UC225_62 TaxID=3350168 RepID=UPI0036D2C374
MNDIISLDSVRRGRGRAAAPGSGAEVETEVTTRDGSPAEEWYSAPTDATEGRPSKNHPAARARTPEAPAAPADSPADSVRRPATLSAVTTLAPVAVLPVVQEISDEERLERVSDTVIRALGRRQLSADETHALLMAQGASDEEAVVLVARYEELGYLDDLALAESLVERLSERNHKSRSVISRELMARKIPAAYVQAALEQLDEGEEFDRALEAAVKRAGQLSSYDDVTAERRLIGFLTRRGYTSGVVREVTRRALAERKGSGGPRFR